MRASELIAELTRLMGETNEDFTVLAPGEPMSCGCCKWEPEPVSSLDQYSVTPRAFVIN